MQDDNQSDEHWLSRHISKLGERRDKLKKKYPHFYWPIILFLLIGYITLQHFYEKWLDSVSWGWLVKTIIYVFYGFWILVIILFFAFDKNRCKKNNVPMSWEPWALLLGFAIVLLIREIHPRTISTTTTNIITNTVYQTQTVTNFIEKPQWYLLIKSVSVPQRAPVNIPPPLLFYRISILVNEQDYDYPTGPGFLSETNSPSETYPLQGQPPFDVRFEGWLTKTGEFPNYRTLPETNAKHLMTGATNQTYEIEAKNQIMTPFLDTKLEITYDVYSVER